MKRLGNHILLVACLLGANIAHAQLLKELSLKKDDFSQELELVVSQLAGSKQIPQAKAKELASAAVLINNDMQKVPLSNALFLVKSEIYKGLLANPLLSTARELSLSESLVKGLEKKLEDHELVYTDFSKWLGQSLLSELAPFRKDGFLDRYQTISGNDVESRAKALQVKKLGKYLSPWILAFTEKSPEEFNELATEVCSDLMLKIAAKSYFFKQFASKHSDESLGELFSVPSLEQPVEIKAQLPATSLEAASQKRRQEGEAAVKSLDQTDLENASEALDKLVEEEAPATEEGGWKPK